MRLGIRSAVAIAAVGMVAVSASLTVGKTQQIQGREATNDPIEVLQLRPNFYMIAGGGGNIGVQVGVDGVVVVDAGSGAKADTVVVAIKKVTTQPIRYLINTSADPDHVGGNETIAKAGQTLFTQGGGAGVAADFLGGGASILAVEQVLTRMSAPTGQASRFPAAALPTETFNQPRKYMYLNGGASTSSINRQHTRTGMQLFSFAVPMSF
jgi:glyoxylase-like metal-dependent hydrolase (beta-lactamase superfamily II)